MQASVKVMRSYDYCHFEVALSDEVGDELTTDLRLIRVDELANKPQFSLTRQCGKIQDRKRRNATGNGKNRKPVIYLRKSNGFKRNPNRNGRSKMPP